MIDFARFEDLLIVRKIREKIRKWWDIELSYADERGFSSESGGRKIIPPHNPFCRAALDNAATCMRCNRSVEKAMSVVREEKEIKAHLFESCHLGFPLVLVPVVDRNNSFHGAIFAGGFIVEDEYESRKKGIFEASAIEGLGIRDPESAYARVPVIGRRDLDYFCDLLETTVEEMVEFGHMLGDKEAKIRELSGELSGRYRFGNIVGKSAPMVRMFSLLEKVANTDSTVLITGENGTGKELIARALHYNGSRKNRSFVAQNVSALNDNLLESEFFGHVRGAFTGATRTKQGLFKVADGGTFFLDEVGEMSMTMQVKLLRVLQEGTFVPVGGTVPEKVDVRIIAATNRKLEDMINERLFREDLYYRLNVINVHVPALRTRKEDIPLLVDYFLEEQAKKFNAPKKKLSPEIMARFYAYGWPGNIRELENEVERLVVLAGDDDVVGADALDFTGGYSSDNRNMERFRLKGDLASAVAELEREMIREGLDSTRWNKTKLADRLGISRTTLIKKIKDYGIENGNASHVDY